MKTAELIGELLDYWVAKAEGHQVDSPLAQGEDWLSREQQLGRKYEPNYCRFSTDWKFGGPILERDRIAIEPGAEDAGNWLADYLHPARTDRVQRTFTTGPTPLIAAMRAKVASVYGDEVLDLTP